MKNFQLLTLVFALFSMTVLMQSCKDDDPCEDVTCQNDGVCIDGTCDCPDGYSGTNCEVGARDKFLGTYSVVEICMGNGNSNTDMYDLSIGLSVVDVNTIVITGLYNPSNSFNAIISENNITIDQVIGVYTYSGTGTIDGNILTINFDVMVQGASESCIATCTKQ